VKFGEISASIAERKCEAIRATGANAVLMGDLGCMLNIEGKLSRMKASDTRVLHVAEVLAGVMPQEGTGS
jgi:L-lactate dehydrogenase complex protein LldE